MQQYYEFLNNVRIVSGLGSIKNLGPACNQCRIKSPLVVTGPHLAKMGMADKVKQMCPDTKKLVIFSDIPQDSDIDAVEKLAKLYTKDDCDGIIAIGGGSVIDTAMAAKLMLSQGAAELQSLMGIDCLTHINKIPFIVIPTTAGTGSEVTKAAVIKDTKKGMKLEFLSREMLPDICILDGELTLTLPLATSIATAFDAFCHAIEGYTSTQRNEIAVEHAKLALKSIWQNLPLLVKNPQDGAVRQALLEASTMAGVCFSNSMVGVVHAIGHAVGAVTNVSHAEAMALLLPHCMRFNMSVLKKYYAEFLLMLCAEAKSIDEEESARANAFIDLLEARVKEYGISAKGRVCESDFDKIVHLAMLDGAILTNVKRVKAQDIKDILGATFLEGNNVL